MLPPPQPAQVYATAPAIAASDNDRTTVQALGEGDLELFWTGTGFTVCGSGTITSDIRVAGVWTLTAVGSGGGLPAVATSTATSFSTCVFVGTGGLPAGTVNADLSYVGIGTGVVVHSIGNGHWAPVVGPGSATFDFTPERP